MSASAVLTRQARHDLRAAIQYIGTGDLAAARDLPRFLTARQP
ncbi:MAG: hypothetical protein E7K72_18820 [Roseomonas mucosa]|nr:hypothetical protein [Roseomonas mucosa]MDU7523407.1 hypothetical protein [Roseomonas mucosa]